MHESFFPMTIPTRPKAATEADRTIGSRITALRTAQGLSQSALASALGVSFQQVQKYEKGRNRIGAGRLQTLADLLGVPVETFFADRAGADDDPASAATWFDDPEVMELVGLFRGITEAEMRRSVLSIVRTAAALHRARGEAGR